MGLNIKRTDITEEEKVEFVEFTTPEDFVYVPLVRPSAANTPNVVNSDTFNANGDAAVTVQEEVKRDDDHHPLQKLTSGEAIRDIGLKKQAASAAACLSATDEVVGSPLQLSEAEDAQSTSDGSNSSNETSKNQPPMHSQAAATTDAV